MPHIAVVGAGIMGLSTALRLQEELPGSDVTIISDRFTPDTTSDCAAGIWAPYLIADTPEHKIREWGRDTLDHIKSIYNTADAHEHGVSMASGIFLYKDKPTDPMYEDMYISYSRLDSTTRESIHPGYTEAYKATTFILEPVKYLPQLMKRFKGNGGKVYKRKVEQLRDLFNRFDIVVNTTGVHAGTLVDDTQIYPQRGQIFKVEAPWIKHFVMEMQGHGYVIPGIDSVVVGGTHQKHDWNLNISQQDGEEILQNAYTILPSLQKATIVKEIVGLRPSRNTVRLECEIMKHRSKSVPVIHNYGHGGSGLTLFWGCSGEAVELVKKCVEELKTTSKMSKL